MLMNSRADRADTRAGGAGWGWGPSNEFFLAAGLIRFRHVDDWGTSCLPDLGRFTSLSS